MAKTPKTKRVTETIEVSDDVPVEVVGKPTATAMIEPVWIYNDSHRPELVQFRHGDGHIDFAIPSDGVASMAPEIADRLLWVYPPHPKLGKPRRINTHLQECTAAEAEAHCQRRGRPVPATVKAPKKGSGT